MAQRTDYQDGDVIFAEFLNNTNRAVNQLENDIANIGQSSTDRPSTDGMGYLVLKQDKSFEEQVTMPDTIYEIRYNHSLNGDVSIPDNCKLHFNGGSLFGGRIVGNKTLIDGNFTSLKEVLNGTSIDGSFSNEQTAFSWWGGVKNDETKDAENGTILKYLLTNRNEVTFDGTFYISLGEIFDVDHHITLMEGEIYWTDYQDNPTAYINPINGFSLTAKNVIFHNTGKTSGFLNANDIDFIIDTLKFDKCSFLDRTRSVTLEFADRPLDEIIGIRNLAITNCYANNNSRVFTINDCQFIDTLSVTGNDFRNFTEAPIYFASNNGKEFAGQRMNQSCVATISNNTFVCNEPCTTSPIYHCSVVAELNVILFENNHIEGIAAICNGNVGAHTCYDAYLSCRNVVYRNNTIRNVMGWRTDGLPKGSSGASYPQTEIFKSKNYSFSKVITGNLFEIDKEWLEKNNVPEVDNWISIFVFQHKQDNVIFANNTINIPSTMLKGRTAVNSGFVVNMAVTNNTFTAKSISNLVHTGGEPAKSVSITGNTFKTTDTPIKILRFTKEETDMESVVVKGNSANNLLSMEYSSLSKPRIKYLEWNAQSDDYNEEEGKVYVYTGSGDSKINVGGNANNLSTIQYAVNAASKTTGVFEYAEIPKTFTIIESLIDQTETNLTKSFTVSIEAIVNGITLSCQCTIQYADGVLQWKSDYQRLSEANEIENFTVFGTIPDERSYSLLRGVTFNGVKINATSSKVIISKSGADTRDDYTTIKYSIRNNGNSRLFTYVEPDLPPVTEDDEVEIPVEVIPTAYFDMNFSTSSGDRVIKYEDDCAKYYTKRNGTSIYYMLTRYAIPDISTNPDAWWSIGVNKTNHLYLKFAYNNKCTNAITGEHLRILYRKGFNASDLSINVTIPKGQGEMIVDVADLLRKANVTSYQNITHMSIDGVRSDTASTSTLVDIEVKVYGLFTQL